MFNNLDTMKPFLDEPTREFNVREFARILKISPTTASKKLKELSKKNILTERKDRVYNFYKANLDSDLYKDIKVFYNIRKLKDSGFIDALNDFYLFPAIILFGSASDGLDTETSDFDLVVISENTKDFPLLNKFEKKLSRELQIFAVEDLKNLRNEQLIINVLNGIKIQGEVSGLKGMFQERTNKKDKSQNSIN